jgi:hypothetical protein
MCPTSAAGGPPVASRQFSADTIGELLRALKARAIDHPESPALIASWPGVSAAQMPAACAELRRQGHDVREVSIARPGAKPRRGWSIEPASGEAAVVRDVADPKTTSVPRVDARSLPMIARLPEFFEIRSRRERLGRVLRMQFNLAGVPAGNR